MPLWVHRVTFQELPSVAEADLPEPVGNYVEDPDLSAVSGQPKKYWELLGDIFSLADSAEMVAIDAAELAATRDSLADEIDRAESYSKAFALTIMDELNILRAQHSLSDRTPSQLKTAVRNRMDT
jgi:hypothetical protein